MSELSRIGQTKSGTIGPKKFILPNVSLPTRSTAQKTGLDTKPDRFDFSSFLDSSRASRKYVHLKTKETVFSQGDRALEVFYIQRGLIQLSSVSTNGKTAVSAVLGSGDFCGVWCLAGQPRRMATATTIGPTTLRSIRKEEMLRLLRTDHEFAGRFISFLLAKNMQIGERLMSFLFDSTEKRLIRTMLFLSRFGISNHKGEVTLPPISQDVLAEMVGSSRTYVNGLIRKLKRLGLIEYDGPLKIHPAPILSLL